MSISSAGCASVPDLVRPMTIIRWVCARSSFSRNDLGAFFLYTRSRFSSARFSSLCFFSPPRDDSDMVGNACIRSLADFSVISPVTDASTSWWSTNFRLRELFAMVAEQLADPCGEDPSCEERPIAKFDPRLHAF